MIESIVYNRNSTVIKLEDLGVINLVSGRLVDLDMELINEVLNRNNLTWSNTYFELDYSPSIRPLHWKEVEQKVEKFYEEFDGNQCFIYTQSYEMIEQFVIQNKTNLKLRYFKPEENGCKSFDNESLAGAFELNMEIR